MKNWLYNNKVIVTGASSGIGKEISKILIFKFNCQVLGIGRNEEKLKNFKNELSDKQDKFSCFAMDVSSFEKWQNLYSQIKGHGYNVVINNAGTMHPFANFDKIEIADAERIFKTNFFSCLYCYKTFAKDFKNKKNTGIINISSASALCCIPGESVYSASKSALCSFSKIIASENNKKFFIATYLPGFTRTNLFSTNDNLKPIFSKMNTRYLNKISMPVEKMAKKIVKAMSKKKRLKKFGTDAFLLGFLNGILPCRSSDFYKWLFKISKLECFKDIFE